MLYLSVLGEVMVIVMVMVTVMVIVMVVMLAATVAAEVVVVQLSFTRTSTEAEENQEDEGVVGFRVQSLEWILFDAGLKVWAQVPCRVLGVEGWDVTRGYTRRL